MLALCITLGLSNASPVQAQTLPAAAPTAASAEPVEPALIENLVAAGRILVAQGVLDGNGITANGRTLFLERFIHAEIYRTRPNVKAVVHSHSPATIPFSVAQVLMQAMFHNSAFIAAGVPVFEIRKAAGTTNMLDGSSVLGKALAATLADKSATLMRSHGNVSVCPSVQMAMFRAVNLEVNARLQLQAIGLDGPLTYLTPEEGVMADNVNEVIAARPWQLWKQQALGK